jgi:hypothetical protein
MQFFTKKIMHKTEPANNQRRKTAGQKNFIYLLMNRFVIQDSRTKKVRVVMIQCFSSNADMCFP